MKSILLAGLLSVASLGWAQEIDQHSEGQCSPNIADIDGNVTVTINCTGVSEQALAQLERYGVDELLPDGEGRRKV